jgi:hypothetical protein
MVSKMRFREQASLCIQRLYGRGLHFVDNRRPCNRFTLAQRTPLQGQSLTATLGALPI